MDNHLTRSNLICRFFFFILKNGFISFPNFIQQEIRVRQEMFKVEMMTLINEDIEFNG